MSEVNATFEKRFWSKVKKTSYCWLWTASVDGKGYGQIGAGGRGTGNVRAHRASWYLKYGVWPSLNLLHECDNRRCVNPDHLKEGTQKQNLQDMVKRGRYGDRKRMSGEAWHKAHGKQWESRQRDSSGRFA